MNRPLSSFLTLLSAALATVTAAVLLVPAALGDPAPVTWSPPTPSDGTQYNVKPGKSVSFALDATADLASIVHISPTKAFPQGVKFNSSDGADGPRQLHLAAGRAGRLHAEVQRLGRRGDGRRADADVSHPRPGNGGQVPGLDDAHQRQDRALGCGAEARRSCARSRERFGASGDDARDA